MIHILRSLLNKNEDGGFIDLMKTISKGSLVRFDLHWAYEDHFD